jgi:hypothetical protein
MLVTLHALVEGGLVNVQDADEFAVRHVCFLASQEGWCRRTLRRLFGNQESSQVLVAKILCGPKENEGEHDAGTE